MSLNPSRIKSIACPNLESLIGHCRRSPAAIPEISLILSKFLNRRIREKCWFLSVCCFPDGSGCGNVHSIFEDYIDAGIDAYNPLEVKAGMDCVDLRKKFDCRIGLCGNSDMPIWESGEPSR